MDIDLVFKIAAIGIVVAVLNQLLVRSDRPDQAMLVSLAAPWRCFPERSCVPHPLFQGTPLL